MGDKSADRACGGDCYAEDGDGSVSLLPGYRQCSTSLGQPVIILLASSAHRHSTADLQLTTPRDRLIPCRLRLGFVPLVWSSLAPTTDSAILHFELLLGTYKYIHFAKCLASNKVLNSIKPLGLRGPTFHYIR